MAQTGRFASRVVPNCPRRGASGHRAWTRIRLAGAAPHRGHGCLDATVSLDYRPGLPLSRRTITHQARERHVTEDRLLVAVATDGAIVEWQARCIEALAAVPGVRFERWLRRPASHDQPPTGKDSGALTPTAIPDALTSDRTRGRPRRSALVGARTAPRRAPGPDEPTVSPRRSRGLPRCGVTDTGRPCPGIRRGRP